MNEGTGVSEPGVWGVPTEGNQRVFPMVPRARVLLAEDDDDVRTLVATALRADGHEVVEVGDGVALLRWVGDILCAGDSGAAPDVIVSDIRMPGYDGVNVLAGLCRAERRIPVILMTAFDDLTTCRKAIRLGAEALFSKPLDLDALCAAVRCLTLRRAFSTR